LFSLVYDYTFDRKQREGHDVVRHSPRVIIAHRYSDKGHKTRTNTDREKTIAAELMC